MKKSFIVIIWLSFVFTVLETTVNAQESDKDLRESLGIGVKAGVNYSNVWDEQGEDFVADGKLGIAGGVFVSIPIGQFLGIQPEVMFSQKGFKGSGTLLGTPYSFTRTTTFLDIPLLLQIKPAEMFTIVLGPQFSYLFNRKDVYAFGNNEVEQENEFDNDNIRKNILGFTFGADINISPIVISGRIGWDFQDNNGDGSSSTPRYKNQWTQLTVGFRF
jgi:hypothetical protein